MSERFNASVQYDDWTGTAAADNADAIGIRKILDDRKLIADDEFLLGIELFIGENHAGIVESPFISVFVVKGKTYEEVADMLKKDTPVPVPKVDIDDLSALEFLGLFKR